MPASIAFTVNGRPVEVSAEPEDTLLDLLRNHLGLTGARFGCGAGQCGACAVIVDGELKAACHTEAGAIAGAKLTTVEALSASSPPHPLIAAFLEKQAGQCGFCLNGILVSASLLLERNREPSRAEIAEALDWHLCRCGAHNRILNAVELAASRLKEPA
ncbi:MAG TPA: (2Fe-2S)-binding protein [Phenylobacterium sp.]|uniref:(2Fe-2S)-binding protein n=1 Tax=Phenylobacterium sp. TaxID=1871053 RepID=UPI002B58DA48|nr:(2Fe-2S)-binding protein [Phenylobacterium sp.]HSV04216.1 (2Fe-2S)-binding protein [Phenylobacterium sp.]